MNNSMVNQETITSSTYDINQSSDVIIKPSLGYSFDNPNGVRSSLSLRTKNISLNLSKNVNLKNLADSFNTDFNATVKLYNIFRINYANTKDLSIAKFLIKDILYKDSKNTLKAGVGFSGEYDKKTLMSDTKKVKLMLQHINQTQKSIFAKSSLKYRYKKNGAGEENQSIIKVDTKIDFKVIAAKISALYNTSNGCRLGIKTNLFGLSPKL